MIELSEWRACINICCRSDCFRDNTFANSYSIYIDIRYFIVYSHSKVNYKERQHYLLQKTIVTVNIWSALQFFDTYTTAMSTITLIDTYIIKLFIPSATQFKLFCWRRFLQGWNFQSAVAVVSYIGSCHLWKLNKKIALRNIKYVFRQKWFVSNDVSHELQNQTSTFSKSKRILESKRTLIHLQRKVSRQAKFIGTWF